MKYVWYVLVAIWLTAVGCLCLNFFNPAPLSAEGAAKLAKSGSESCLSDINDRIESAARKGRLGLLVPDQDGYDCVIENHGELEDRGFEIVIVNISHALTIHWYPPDQD